MGFFQNIKNKLGIGGVKVSLEIPAQANKADGTVEGKISLTTKSEQEVKGIVVKMIEKYTTGRGDEKSIKELTLGEIKLNEVFTIKPEETKVIPFTLNFSIIKSSNDELKEKGGALGALGKVGAFADNEKSEYFVEADIDVSSASLDPSDKKQIKLA